MLAHRSVHWTWPFVVSKVICRLGAVLPLGMARSHAALDPAGAGGLALGCLASAGGIGAGEFPKEVIYASIVGLWSARVEGLKGEGLYPGGAY